MKRWTRALAGATLALLCLGIGTAAAQPTPGVTFWNFLLVDPAQPASATVGSTVPATCAIYNAGTTTLATNIYTDTFLQTAQANPMTATPFGNSVGNSCFFYSTRSITSYDVFVYSKLGRARFTLTPTIHSMPLGRTDKALKVVKIPWGPGLPVPNSGSYFSTGVTIPAGSKIYDVLVETIVAGTSAAHIVVGILESNLAGLCANSTALGTTGVSVGTVGWQSCMTPKFNGDGSVASSHAGALMAKTVAAGATHVGAFIPIGFLGDGTNKTISYHTGSTATLIGSAAGNLYVIYDEVGPVGANTP